MDRRQFLIVCAGSITAVACTGQTSDEVTIDRLVADPSGARRFVDASPGLAEDSNAAAARLRLTPADPPSRGWKATATGLSSALSEQSVADVDHERFVVVGGWLLTQTEVDLAIAVAATVSR